MDLSSEFERKTHPITNCKCWHVFTQVPFCIYPNVPCLILFLELLKEMDLEKEMGKLGENRALGDRRHRHLVMKMYQETQLALAQTIFCLAAQKGLSRADLSRFALVNINLYISLFHLAV